MMRRFLSPAFAVLIAVVGAWLLASVQDEHDIYNPPPVKEASK